MDLQHNLVVVDVHGVDRPTVACKACGAYMMEQCRSLGSRCRGKLHRLSNWRRIFVHGRHPRLNALVKAIVPLHVPVVFDAEHFKAEVVWQHDRSLPRVLTPSVASHGNAMQGSALSAHLDRDDASLFSDSD